MSLHLCHSSFSNPSIVIPTSQLMLQPFCCFTYVTVHSPTLFFASPTSQALHLNHLALLILQPFRHFTYVITHSPTLPSLYLRHSSFPNPSVASPTSQFILQPFFRISYVTSSSLNSSGEPSMIHIILQPFPSLHLRYNSFSNPFFALPMPQLILQAFRCFNYVTTHSPTLSSLHLRHSSFSNPSVASTTSQFILQPFFRFSYVTSSSLNSPDEPSMI